MKDCIIPSAIAMVILQSRTTPSFCSVHKQFGHLAIAVSPRLEVEIGGHASLDGCNFQRKRPGPHGVPPTPPCVHSEATMRLMIMIYNAGNLYK